MLRLVDHFPDPKDHRFDKSEWIDCHGKSSVIIHCESTAVSFPKHWGPLSLKTTLKGSEFYVTDRGKYKVSPDNFLILNEDTQYASFIPENSQAESLTFNFGSVFLNSFNQLWEKEESKWMDDPSMGITYRCKFPEHLNKHHTLVYPHLRKIARFISDFKLHAGRIEEEMSFLFEGLLRSGIETYRRIDRIAAKKRATREEIYQRIHIARDYMDACFNEDISMKKLSELSCLSSHHFLRHFKSYFRITPRQYLIKRRLEAAKELLGRKDLTVSEVCRRVGFEDRSSFTRLYTSHFNNSPSHFRR